MQDLQHQQSIEDVERLLQEGRDFLDHSQFDEATKVFSDALQILESIEEKTLEAKCLNGLAVAYHSLEKYPQAIELLKNGYKFHVLFRIPN